MAEYISLQIQPIQYLLNFLMLTLYFNPTCNLGVFLFLSPSNFLRVIHTGLIKSEIFSHNRKLTSIGSLLVEQNIFHTFGLWFSFCDSKSKLLIF